MSPEIVACLIFTVLLILMVCNVPIAVALGATGILFTWWLWGVEALNMIPFKLFSVMNSSVLIAIPLFIMMGCVLERSGIAEDLYILMQALIGRFNGGLLIGTILISTIFAAMAGVTGAATVSMGVIALPIMMKLKYDKKLILGSIGAGGALGVIIPPSIVIVIYGMFTELSVGKLFAGGLSVGVILSIIYCIYVQLRCYFNPKLGPAITKGEVPKLIDVVVQFKSLIPIALLIVFVLGSIFSGIATPTEASAIGAVGSIICAMVYGSFAYKLFKEALLTTVALSGMVFWLLVGGSILSSTFFGVGAPDAVKAFILALDLPRWGVIAIFMAILFILGFFLDPGAIIMITTPFFIPIIKSLEIDPLWFGILFNTNMQMAYITPPFGFNLFYLKAAAPPDTKMVDIYKSVFPFVMLQAITLVIIILFPGVVTWLPNLIF